MTDIMKTGLNFSELKRKLLMQAGRLAMQLTCSYYYVLNKYTLNLSPALITQMKANFCIKPVLLKYYHTLPH